MVLENPLSQIVVGICFILLIIVLFFDSQDYLSFSVLFLMISAIATTIDLENPPTLEDYILSIDWAVIIFLISMFTIVEILNKARVFQKIAKFIVMRTRTNVRLMFYLICIVSTLSASILEDISVAIIFIPIIIFACEEIEVNPSPFLFGMTICINLASTLTPFGSAENIMIAQEFGLTLTFFLSNLSIYFVITTAITLILLDKFVLQKSMKERWQADCSNQVSPISPNTPSIRDLPSDIVVPIKPIGKIDVLIPLSEEIPANKILFWKNLVGLLVFTALLLFIHEIHVAGMIGLLIFVFLNAEKNEKGSYHPKLSNFLRKVDYKLIYFFICLFVLVYLMDVNGTIHILENFIKTMALDNVFVLSIVIVLMTSILSGFLDNAPVTIVFLPIINILIDEGGFAATPLLIAFILGVNLGGNFLPQGSAADMMTLELSQQHCVDEVNYKSLTRLGGTFALMHVILGIGYLAFLIYVFPGF
ncbi:MAG: SLC13 family permease [Promethearchaeota archaeon]